MESIKENTIIRKTVSLYLKQWEQIEQEAKKKNYTQAEIIRKIIDMYFNEIGKED